MMNARLTGLLCIAVLATAGTPVFAQITPPPAPRPAGEGQQPAATAPAELSMTLVGCVERETDYRRTHNAGRGGAAGTGAGVANEFVLTNAAPTAPGAAAADQAATGTAGATGGAYQLTGPGEGQLEAYVGRRVEISGRMKPDTQAAAAARKAPAVTATVPQSSTGRPGGATAVGSPSGRTGGQPAGGIELTGRDLPLKEFEVVLVKEAAGACAK